MLNAGTFVTDTRCGLEVPSRLVLDDVHERRVHFLLNAFSDCPEVTGRLMSINTETSERAVTGILSVYAFMADAMKPNGCPAISGKPHEKLERTYSYLVEGLSPGEIAVEHGVRRTSTAIQSMMNGILGRTCIAAQLRSAMKPPKTKYGFDINIPLITQDTVVGALLAELSPATTVRDEVAEVPAPVAASEDVATTRLEGPGPATSIVKLSLSELWDRDIVERSKTRDEPDTTSIEPADDEAIPGDIDNIDPGDLVEDAFCGRMSKDAASAVRRHFSLEQPQPDDSTPEPFSGPTAAAVRVRYNAVRGRIRAIAPVLGLIGDRLLGTRGAPMSARTLHNLMSSGQLEKTKSLLNTAGMTLEEAILAIARIIAE